MRMNNPFKLPIPSLTDVKNPVINRNSRFNTGGGWIYTGITQQLLRSLCKSRLSWGVLWWGLRNNHCFGGDSTGNLRGVNTHRPTFPRSFTLWSGFRSIIPVCEKTTTAALAFGMTRVPEPESSGLFGKTGVSCSRRSPPVVTAGGTAFEVAALSATSSRALFSPSIPEDEDGSWCSPFKVFSHSSFDLFVFLASLRGTSH